MHTPSSPLQPTDGADEGGSLPPDRHAQVIGTGSIRARWMREAREAPTPEQAERAEKLNLADTCRTQQRYSSATCQRHAGHDGDHEFPEVKPRKTKQRRDSREFRVASMLAIILDEPYDNPDNPDEIRIKQARELLSAWSSAQSSLIGALVELVNLKQGNCVRCPERPCPVCGAQKVDGLI